MSLTSSSPYKLVLVLSELVLRGGFLVQNTARSPVTLTDMLTLTTGRFLDQEGNVRVHFMTMLHFMFGNSGDIRTTGFQGMIVYSEPISKEFSTLEITPAALQRLYKT